jgi:hypothetical protein
MTSEVGSLPEFQATGRRRAGQTRVNEAKDFARRGEVCPTSMSDEAPIYSNARRLAKSEASRSFRRRGDVGLYREEYPSERTTLDEVPECLGAPSSGNVLATIGLTWPDLRSSVIVVHASAQADTG